MDLTCNVCEENEAVGVANGACGPVSFAYCRACLQAGAEPWHALVAYAAGAWVPDNIYADWFEKVIERNLDFHDKTREEFNADVEAAAKEMEAYL